MSQDFISDQCFNLDNILSSVNKEGREECASEIIDAFDSCDEAAWESQECADLGTAISELDAYTPELFT